MTATSLQELTLHLPGELIERISEAANRRKQPLDQVVMEVLEISLPPLSPSTEAKIQLRQEELEAETTIRLRTIRVARLPDTNQARLSKLLEINRTRKLTSEENLEIEALLDKVEERAAERALAMLVLKERTTKNAVK